VRLVDEVVADVEQVRVAVAVFDGRFHVEGEFR
jgi:hypothetical protein